jgi:hypothetical protein
MPANTTWSRYLAFQAAGLVSMFLGSQCVHLYYRPLDDLPEYLQKERKRREAETAAEKLAKARVIPLVDSKSQGQ